MRQGLFFQQFFQVFLVQGFFHLLCKPGSDFGSVPVTNGLDHQFSELCAADRLSKDIEYCPPKGLPFGFEFSKEG